jgi:hypothetical protein
MFSTVTDSQMNYHRAKRVVHFNNKIYFIAYDPPEAEQVTLYEMSSYYSTYDGKSIPRYRILPPVRLPDGRRFVIRRISITMNQGQSRLFQRVGLSISVDGGNSFGNWTYRECNTRGYGANRVDFYGLGSANDLTPKLAFWTGNGVTDSNRQVSSNEENFALISAEIEIL